MSNKAGITPLKDLFLEIPSLAFIKMWLLDVLGGEWLIESRAS